MSATPDLSVVVATYRRAEVLRETLARLAAQRLPAARFEVIVADDGSPDDTPDMVAAVTPHMPYALRYLRHDNRGPGYTENEGIRAARGDLVLLMADDIWAAPEMLEQHLATHARHPAAHIGVLGGVSQSPSLPATVLHRHWDPFQYGRFRDGEELDGVHFMACNVSVKRRFLLEHGLFLERRGAAHEDIELGYRLRSRGLRLVYNAAARAEHHHAETLEGICRRAFERGRNFDLLLGTMPPEFALPLYKIWDPAAGLRACLAMLPRELPRALLFNALTVPHVWRPLLDAAEHNGLARLFASGAAYRGVAGHYLRAGLRSCGPLATQRPTRQPT